MYRHHYDAGHYYVAGRGVQHDGFVFVSGGGHVRDLPDSDRSPGLILVGEKDWAFSLAKRTEKAFQERNVPVTLKIYPGQGHFLLAVERKKVLGDVVGWIQGRLDRPAGRASTD